MDGANLNAIMGRFKPGEAGFDVMHFNVHKTFSTPHGGGGPGAGPVGVGETLLPFLPEPRVLRGDDGAFRLERIGERPTSIGRMRSFVGNTGVLVRAYAYIRAHGGSGLREVSDDAVLAANYLMHRIAGTYDIPYGRACKHEFVASAASIKKRTGVRTLDIAKRLIDKGFHPPTIYFPLIVEEGMLIEPTETESVETLDAFADALIAIAAEAEADPDLVTSAPHDAPVRRLDEVTAARQPNLRWRPMAGAANAVSRLRCRRNGWTQAYLTSATECRNDVRVLTPAARCTWSAARRGHVARTIWEDRRPRAKPRTLGETPGGISSPTVERHAPRRLSCPDALDGGRATDTRRLRRGGRDAGHPERMARCS